MKHHGNDRRLPRQQIKSGLVHTRPEALGVRRQCLAAVVGFPGNFDCLDRSGRNCWSEAVGEEVGA